MNWFSGDIQAVGYPVSRNSLRIVEHMKNLALVVLFSVCSLGQRTAPITSPSINNTLFVGGSGMAAGADIGVQITNAYRSCPTTGCKIHVLAGNYSFSTTINLNSAVPVSLECDSGANGLTSTSGSTQLIYKGSGTAMIFASGGFTGGGMEGCTLTGPGTGGSTTGLLIAGSVGYLFQMNDISNFNIGVQLGPVSGVANSILDFKHLFIGGSVHDNGQNLVTGNGSDESNVFVGVLFSSQANGFNPACIQLGNSSGSNVYPTEVSFIGGSADQCGITISNPSSRVRFTDFHLENPVAATKNDFITVAANCLGCTVSLTDTDIYENFNGAGRTQMISINTTGTMHFSLVNGQFYAGREAPVTDLVKINGGNNLVTVEPLYLNGITHPLSPHTGIAIATMMPGNLTVGDYASTAQLDQQGDVVQSGVPFARLNATPVVGMTQFCTNCVPTTPSACATNSPASCVCKAGTGSMWAKYENFMNNGANWYCH
jgi:hypothetical protein